MTIHLYFFPGAQPSLDADEIIKGLIGRTAGRLRVPDKERAFELGHSFWYKLPDIKALLAIKMTDGVSIPSWPHSLERIDHGRKWPQGQVMLVEHYSEGVLHNDGNEPATYNLWHQQFYHHGESIAGRSWFVPDCWQRQKSFPEGWEKLIADSGKETDERYLNLRKSLVAESGVDDVRRTLYREGKRSQ